MDYVRKQTLVCLNWTKQLWCENAHKVDVFELWKETGVQIEN